MILTSSHLLQIPIRQLNTAYLHNFSTADTKF